MDPKSKVQILQDTNNSLMSHSWRSRVLHDSPEGAFNKSKIFPSRVSTPNNHALKNSSLSNNNNDNNIYFF